MRKVKVIAECYICKAPIILYKHEDGTDRIGYVCSCNKEQQTPVYPIPYIPNPYPVDPYPFKYPLSPNVPYIDPNVPLKWGQPGDFPSYRKYKITCDNNEMITF